MSKQVSKKNTKKSVPPKRHNVSKILIAVLCLLLIGAIATSLAFNVIQYKKLTKIKDDAAPPLEGDNVIVTPIDPAPGIALLSLDQDEIVASDEILIVPVTVTPEVDEPIMLDWTVAFANPATEWASDKNVEDYVTATKTSERGADIMIGQVFGEQVIVTASLIDKPDVSVCCTVDYARRYTFVGFKYEPTETNYNLAATKITAELEKSLGTIDEDYTESFNITINQNFMNFYNNILIPAFEKIETGNNIVDLAQSFVSWYSETGTSSITPKMFSVAPQSNSSYLVASNLDITDDRAYTLHMQKLFNYLILIGNYKSSMLSLYDFSQGLSAYSATDVATVNAAINQNILDLKGQFGYGWLVQPSNGIIKVRSAFNLEYTLSSEHNQISTHKAMDLAFKLFPAQSNSLEIDQPSIVA